jgi:hypothetical protein
MRRLLIDDVRYDKEDIYDIPMCDVVCRNPVDGIQALERLELFDELYLDHDMGIQGGIELDSGGIVEYSGYGVLCWLEEHPEHMPKAIILVTDNGSAAVKMAAMLLKYYPHRVGRCFSKNDV